MSDIPCENTLASQREEDTRRISTIWESVQQRKVPTITQTHHMGPRDRTPPEHARYFASTTPSVESDGTKRNAEVCRRTSSMRNHSRIMEPIRCKLLFHKKERWKVMPHPRLLAYQ
jgi:hypothetical protein